MKYKLDGFLLFSRHIRYFFRFLIDRVNCVYVQPFNKYRKKNESHNSNMVAIILPYFIFITNKKGIWTQASCEFHYFCT